MSDNPEDYELFHYGVKGMKWGVRKRRDAIVSGARRFGAATNRERAGMARRGAVAGVRSTGRGTVRAAKSMTISRQSTSKARVDKLLERHGGSKTKAIAHTLAVNTGKAAALGVFGAVTQARGNNLTRTATGIATTAGIVGLTARNVQDTANIIRSPRRDR